MKNACHKKELAALRRIEGQVRGIERMIDNGDYCVDILNQIKAAKNNIKMMLSGSKMLDCY